MGYYDSHRFSVSSARLLGTFSIVAYSALLVGSAGDSRRGVELVRQFHERYPPSASLPPATDTDSSESADTLVTDLVIATRSSAPVLRLPTTSFPTRVSLTAPQPLVRLTTNSQIPDNTIPPFLTFGDMEVLHHRLKTGSSIGPAEDRKQREKDMRFLTWVCRSYGGALQRRKKWAVHGA